MWELLGPNFYVQEILIMLRAARALGVSNTSYHV